MAEEEFDRIVEAVPELAALDDGFTIQISGPGSAVSVTRVEYEQWVKELTEHVVRDPQGWVDGLASFVHHPGAVRYAVVHESFLCVAEMVFSSIEPFRMQALLSAMNKMALYCRLELSTLVGGSK